MLMHLRKASLVDNFVSDYHLQSTDVQVQPIQFNSDAGASAFSEGTTAEGYSDTTEMSPIGVSSTGRRQPRKTGGKDIEGGMAFAQRSETSTVDYHQ